VEGAWSEVRSSRTWKVLTASKMKICIYFPDKKATYVFSNEGLQVGDQVFPIVDGQLIGGEWCLTGLRLRSGMQSDEKEYCTGFPNDPHTILNLSHSDDRSHEVRTNHGYGPVEGYFKLVKVIEREPVKPIKPIKNNGTSDL
jgi:hypothetical protein